MTDIISERSDKIPGIYVCKECGNRIGTLQESWRKHDPTACSFATLFCRECGVKLRSIGVEVEPIRLTQFDILNLGGVV